MCFPIPTQHEACGVFPWVRLLYQLSARTATFEPKPSPINTGSFVEHGTIRKCRSSPCLSVPGNKNRPTIEEGHEATMVRDMNSSRVEHLLKEVPWGTCKLLEHMGVSKRHWMLL